LQVPHQYAPNMTQICRTGYRCGSGIPAICVTLCEHTLINDKKTDISPKIYTIY